MLPISISISNLVQIDHDGGRRHLGFVIRRFWTTHDVGNIMILLFHDFVWRMPIPANFGGFWEILTP